MAVLVCFLLSAILVYVEGGCNVAQISTCMGSELLSSEPLGLLAPEDTNKLCSVLDSLTECLNNVAGDCPMAETIFWRSSLLSATAICPYEEVYLDSVDCYQQEEIVEKYNICGENLSNNLTCSAFDDFENCSLKAVSKYCSPEAVSLMQKIIRRNSQPKRSAIMCPDSEMTVEESEQSGMVDDVETITMTNTIKDDEMEGSGSQVYIANTFTVFAAFTAHYTLRH